MCRNIGMTSRHHSPRAIAGPNLAPNRTRFSLFCDPPVASSAIHINTFTARSTNVTGVVCRETALPNLPDTFIRST